MKPDQPHLHTPDVLRGIAALAVCGYHFTGSELPRTRYAPFADAFSWGWAGVEIFFVLSGFIIPYVLIQSGYRPAQFGQFMLKRFIRICPPSWVLLLITMAQFSYISGYVHPASDWTAHMTAAGIGHNFTYTIPFTHYRWLNIGYWTLAVEFQYYLFIGLFFPVVFRNTGLFIGSALVMACLFYLPCAGQAEFLRYASLFFTGGAALLYFERRIGRGAFLLLVGSLAALTCYQLTWIHALTGLLTALAIAFLRIRSRLGAFFGKISYSLYLVHILAGSDLEVLLVKIIPPVSVLHKMAVLLACLTGTILCAWVFHTLVEAPFVRLSGRLFRKKDVPHPEA